MLIKRLLAFFVDWAILVLIMATIAIWGELFKNIEIHIAIIFILLVPILFLTKDFNGVCVGKRICGLNIICINGEKPSHIKLVVRNLTVIILPIEVILILLGKRRIGDLIAGTEVIYR